MGDVDRMRAEVVERMDFCARVIRRARRIRPRVSPAGAGEVDQIIADQIALSGYDVRQKPPRPPHSTP